MGRESGSGRADPIIFLICADGPAWGWGGGWGGGLGRGLAAPQPHPRWGRGGQTGGGSGRASSSRPPSRCGRGEAARSRHPPTPPLSSPPIHACCPSTSGQRELGWGAPLWPPEGTTLVGSSGFPRTAGARPHHLELKLEGAHLRKALTGHVRDLPAACWRPPPPPATPKPAAQRRRPRPLAPTTPQPLRGCSRTLGRPCGWSSWVGLAATWGC